MDRAPIWPLLYDWEGQASVAETLDGCRVLIVEDEALVAMLLEDILDDLGCKVAGSASNVAKALELVRDNDLDCAVIDLNLGDETSRPVADALAAKGVPFIIVSGYGEGGVRSDFPTAVVVGKPFQAEDLRRALHLVRG